MVGDAGGKPLGGDKNRAHRVSSCTLRGLLDNVNTPESPWPLGPRRRAFPDGLWIALNRRRSATAPRRRLASHQQNRAHTARRRLAVAGVLLIRAEMTSHRVSKAGHFGIRRGEDRVRPHPLLRRSLTSRTALDQRVRDGARLERTSSGNAHLHHGSGRHWIRHRLNASDGGR